MTITAFTGKIRSGKSLGQLHHALRECNLKRRTLVTNFNLDVSALIKYCAMAKYSWLGHHIGRGQYYIFDANTKLSEILSIPESVVCLDEAGIFLNARNWQSTSKQLLVDLCQSGKDGVDLIYTAQFLEQVDSQFRQLTQYYVHAAGFTKWSRSLRRPALVWKRYFYFDAEDYLTWSSSSFRSNYFATRFKYSFLTVEGFLSPLDKQAFACFSSLARLDKQAAFTYSPPPVTPAPYLYSSSHRFIKKGFLSW